MATLASPVWSLRVTLVAALAGAVLVLTGITGLQIIGGVLIAAAVVLPIARLSLVAKPPMRSEEDRVLTDEMMSMPLTELGISDDILERLRTRHITTVGKLLVCDPDMLLTIPGFDPASLLEVRHALAQADFLLAMLDEDRQSVEDNVELFEQVATWLREAQRAAQRRQHRPVQTRAS